MIISESGLTRRIKKAYSNGGYMVARLENDLAIYTDMWFVQCSEAEFPRKALAAIVEHSGMLLAKSSAMKVQKDCAPQIGMYENILQEIRDWTKVETYEDTNPTLITYRGMKIFQASEEDQYNCYGVWESMLELLERTDGIAVAADSSRLCWYYDGEQVILPCVSGYLTPRDYQDKKIWEMFESINLKQKKEEDE